ncbi:putative membrane protein YphA (DoxX/SURF4 family) [Kibdelosporangium banguiense]|uniref:Membrane protein YphA (DoxX/SURF4 family) n=1 Tax=Kibdelosporangium banguiense TaxID=1365924 RepID=A0ABS4TKE9_9PSEU|nr:DoxX family protein [Kibdelosporangium banguiense]MBP2324459.1 putative membrane protein YphA (DoxX/SURF4 family) [Kibdelosporangium banguiense]
MNVVLWVIASLLAAVFLVAGGMKLVQPREKLASNGLEWTEDFSAGLVRFIGTAEVLAAVGLILPALLGIAEVLVPLAAVGVVLLMIGAAITHGRRKEAQLIPANLVLLVLAAVVAWGRFGPYSFTS